VIYHTLALQGVLTLMAGAALLWFGVRAGVATRPRQLVAPAAYAMGIGYGYLAVEIVLIHELVLFVGHPTYAITAVIGSMLLGSGLGSLAAGLVPQRNVVATRNAAVAVVVLLGAAHAFGASSLLESALLGTGLMARIAGVVVLLLPLGFTMGMPWPLFVRSLPDGLASLVPWAWALNGWMSVVASVATVIASRLWGYDAATGMALAGYGVAASAGFWLSGPGSEQAAEGS
jgi:hypothetical protein